MRYKYAIALSLLLSLTAAQGGLLAANEEQPNMSAEDAPAVSGLSPHHLAAADFEYAYIDKTGKSVINGPFTSARSFSHGVAVVNEKPYEWHDGQWHVPAPPLNVHNDTIINTKGKVVGHSAFQSIEPFEDDYTVAYVREKSHGSHFVLVDHHGATIPVPACLQATHYAEGLFAIKSDTEEARNEKHADGFGYMDKSGKLAIPYKYSVAGAFSEGLASVAIRQTADSSAAKSTARVGARPHLYSYSFIDKSGATVIPGPFQETRSFKDGFCAVCLNDKWGFVDKLGKQTIPCQYDWAGDFNQDLAPVEKNGLVGFIDKSGKESIAFKFKDAGSFEDDLAPATADGITWGFIDRAGAFKIAPQFKKAYSFGDGLALVHIKPRTDIGSRPEEAEYFYKTGNQLREDGKLNEAIRYCDVAIKLAPESDWGKRAATLKVVALPDHVISDELIELLQRGTVSAEKHEFDAAARQFQECLDKDPGFVQASGSLGYVLNSQQKYDEAAAVLTKTLAKYPNYARGYFRLAQSYEGQGKIDLAQATLDKAQQLAPDDLLLQVYNLTAAPR